MTVIHWFRRDLRLDDNRAFHAALRSGEQIVPVFIFDPAILASPRTGAPRVAFLLNALRSLDKTLRAHGGRLLIRYGDPAVVLPPLVRSIRASAVYAHADYSPFAQRRESTVAHTLGVPLRVVDDVLLRAPGDVMALSGEPYRVFTPFMNSWRKLPAPPRPATLPIDAGVFYPLVGIENPGVPELAELGIVSTITVPVADSRIARQRLETFVNGPIYAYGHSRNALINDPFGADPAVGTSYLSPYLRFGLLSPRVVYWAAQEALTAAPDDDARAAVNTWINELIWREFYAHILYHFPHVDRGNFRREYDALQWRDAPQEFAAWQRGETGYPVVDAAMRQLRQIGWMPNRARMIVASFLTKDLLIHWQTGEQHFMQWLIDGDPAANNGGWQWAAGTGTDAQPYFRIFNPVAQGHTYDPQGEYVRHWVPELRDVPNRHLHAPWRMDVPPANYPPPIVDHTAARQRTLAAFKAIKR
jgi:deoxyribodipyrimidine photo-lyase